MQILIDMGRYSLHVESFPHFVLQKSSAYEERTKFYNLSHFQNKIL